MRHSQVDAIAQSLGYRHIGGMVTNHVYLHADRAEVLKVAVANDPIALQYASAQLRRCLEVSRIYAQHGVMPEVLAVGDNFHATGYPWLRERYIAGTNLGAAYLVEPKFWIAHVPQELVRIAQLIAGTHTANVTATWHEKLAGMTCSPGYETIYTAVIASGKYLAEYSTTGHIIHGDLQFGNILVQHAGEASRLWLIDWEVSEIMPLSYEFAMLYTFLLGPEAQVELPYQQRYAALKPLRAFWAALAPRLLTELGISEDEMRHAVIFRMGNSWLYQLARAVEYKNTARAAELEHDLQDLVTGRCFDVLPYP